MVACSSMCVELVYTQPAIAAYKGLYHGCSCGRHIYSIRTGRQLKLSKSGRVFVTDITLARSWQYPRDISPPIGYKDKGGDENDDDSGSDADMNTESDSYSDSEGSVARDSSFARSSCVAILDAFAAMFVSAVFALVIAHNLLAWPADVLLTDTL